MPKIRPDQLRKVVREAAASPLGRSSEELESAAHAHREQLLTKLDSLEDSERTWALDSVARLLGEDAAVFRRVVDAPDVLPRIVRALLRDSPRAVRRAAAGVVRNALLVGEERVASKLLALDVALAVEAVLQEAPALAREAHAAPGSSAESGAQDDAQEAAQAASVAEDLLVQSLAYTALLCELVEPLASKLLAAGVVDTLLPLCSPKQGTLVTQLAAASLLRVLVEDAPVPGRVVSAAVAQSLKLLVANQQHPWALRVPLLAALCAAYPLHAHRDDLLRLALPTLHAALAYDAHAFPAQLATTPHVLGALERGAVPSDVRSALAQWQQCVAAQASALELLANALVDEDDEGMDVVGAELHELDDEGHGALSAADAHAADTAAAPLTVALVRALVEAGLLDAALARCTPLAPALAALRTSVPVLVPGLLGVVDVQVRALSVVANAIDVAPLAVLGDAAALWARLYALLEACEAGAALDVLECLVLALHSLARRVPLPASEGVFATALRLSRHTASSVVAVHALGLLALFVTPSAVAGVVDAVLQRLREGLAAPVTPASSLLLCECLNVVFDKFDDHHDELVRRVGLVAQLRALVPRLQALAKEARAAKLKLEFDRLDEARVNLTRFIKYKERQGKGF